ncbi:gamma-glutamyltranspeptidase [Halobacillus andaensis]|uniref:Glutathione hydrolase proenzyme n=2 Tax=Halobacillus andaensis TaxID=1176239 RepID=A0A917B1A9_HALAA|nr:gamma-glutamyltranspeptidase/glutathione hydrolase [Halobacillus andaensis]GGF13468.1 gamma-glutamyltranspeptidase [Halobacillus andaensis]
MNVKRTRFLSWFVMIVLLFTMSLPAGALAKGPQQSNDEVAYGTEGMVATAHPAASEIGAEVLRKGGTAMDAAIAIQLALNVAEPMMSGIGGGGFMMVYDANEDDVSIIDSRERAPAGATPDMFLDENGNVIPFSERHISGDAVGVPGTLKGLMTAHEEWGTQPFNQLINPAIKLAQKGVEVNDVLADAIEDNQYELGRSAAKDVFMPNGEPLQEGELLVQEDLANTFKEIRKSGLDAFYGGEIGQALADTVQEFGGSMTSQDLANYELSIDEPVTGTYRGYEIVSMSPPSSGGLTVLQMLKMLEGFDFSEYDARSPEKYHLLAEAMHLAYADRNAYIGDTQFVDVPMEGMLNEEYLAERASLIEFGQANENVEPGDPWAYQDGAPEATVNEEDDREIGETTHFSVADKWGNHVSYTTTIEQVFGSGIMVPEYGFMLNNEITDFSAVPGGPNQVEPNKRPMSSMTPTMVFEDGEPFMTLGSPGGPTIITSVLQTLVNVIDYDMELKDAIEEPRIYSASYPQIRWEEGIPTDVRDTMEEWGHEWQSSPVEIGNVQAIKILEDGTYKGAADSSRAGTAVGLDKTAGKPLKK